MADLRGQIMKESALDTPGLTGHKAAAHDEQSHDSEKQNLTSKMKTGFSKLKAKFGHSSHDTDSSSETSGQSTPTGAQVSGSTTVPGTVQSSPAETGVSGSKTATGFQQSFPAGSEVVLGSRTVPGTEQSLSEYSMKTPTSTPVMATGHTGSAIAGAGGIGSSPAIVNSREQASTVSTPSTIIGTAQAAPFYGQHDTRAAGTVGVVDKAKDVSELTAARTTGGQFAGNLPGNLSSGQSVFEKNKLGAGYDSPATGGAQSNESVFEKSLYSKDDSAPRTAADSYSSGATKQTSSAYDRTTGAASDHNQARDTAAATYQKAADTASDVSARAGETASAAYNKTAQAASDTGAYTSDTAKSAYNKTAQAASETGAYASDTAKSAYDKTAQAASDTAAYTSDTARSAYDKTAQAASNTAAYTADTARAAYDKTAQVAADAGAYTADTARVAYDKTAQAASNTAAYASETARAAYDRAAETAEPYKQSAVDSLHQTKEAAIDKTEETTGVSDLRSEQKPLTTKAYEVVAGAAGAVAGAAGAAAGAAGNAASSVAASAQPHVEAAKETAIDATEQTTGATDLRSGEKPLTSKVVGVASGAAGATAGAVAAAAAAAKQAIFGKGATQLDDKTIAESKYVIGGEGLTTPAGGTTTTAYASDSHPAATAAGNAAREAVLGGAQGTGASTGTGIHSAGATRDSNMVTAMLVNTSNTTPESGSLLSSGNAPLSSGTSATPISTGSDFSNTSAVSGDSRTIYQKAVDAATGAKEAFFGHPVGTPEAVMAQREEVGGSVPPPSPRTLAQKVADAATGAKEAFMHGITMTPEEKKAAEAKELLVARMQDASLVDKPATQVASEAAVATKESVFGPPEAAAKHGFEKPLATQAQEAVIQAKDTATPYVQAGVEKATPYVQAAADKTAELAAQARDTAAPYAAQARDSVAQSAVAAKDAVVGAAVSAKDTAANYAGQASDATAAYATSAKNAAAEYTGAAQKTASDYAAGARDTVQGRSAGVGGAASQGYDNDAALRAVSAGSAKVPLAGQGEHKGGIAAVIHTGGKGEWVAGTPPAE